MAGRVEPPALTRRERDVLLALCRPLVAGEAFTEPASVREIADELVVTQAAVKQHLGHLYEKFGIASQGERRRVRLANEAFRRGTVELESLDAPVESLVAGRAAFERREWVEAFRLLTAAEAAGPLSGEDLDLLAEAGLWSDRHAESLAARQRAYQAHRSADLPGRAALAALGLVIHYASRLDLAVAGAWLGRAEQLLAELPTGPEHGHLALVRTLIHESEGEWEAALATAQEMREIGRRHDDVDLSVLGLTFQGFVLTRQGAIEKGTRLLDQAMAAALGGELSMLATGIVYCRMICSCLDRHDYRRAGEWTDAVEQCRVITGMGGFPGDCRTHRVAVLVQRGAWSEGQREAARAREEAGAFHLPHAGVASHELGEIRLRLGDLAGAEEAFLVARELGHDPQPGIALLRLAQGEAAAARSSIEEALADPARDALARSRLLPAHVEICLAAGDRVAADAGAGELSEIAETYGTPALEAAAACARGALELASGGAADAARCLAKGEALWRRAEVPYEAARALALLAEAHLAAGARESCLLALGAARSAFERLGARPDAERAGRRVAELAS